MATRVVEVADAFDRGFRAVGRLIARNRSLILLLTGYVAWSLISAALGLGLIQFLTIVSLMVSGLLLRRAIQVGRQSQKVAINAELQSQQAREMVAEEHAARTKAESELGMAQTSLRTSSMALAVLNGATLPLDRDAIVSAVQIAVSRLLALVEGMDDQRRAQGILDVAEQLRTLCSELDDDDAVAASVNSRLAAAQHQITEHVRRVVDEAVHRLGEAGLQGGVLTPPPGGWTP